MTHQFHFFGQGNTYMKKYFKIFIMALLVIALNNWK